MIKGILFDFDGTLADTIPGIIKTCEATRDKIGIPFSMEKARAIIGKPLIDMGRELVGEEKANLFFITYLSLFPEIGGKLVRFFPDIIPLVEELRKKDLFCAIVSSKREENILANLKNAGGEGLFDLIVANESTVFHKPHPAPVEFALEKLGLETGEAIMVGDTDFDIQSGKGAGVKTIGVTWGVCSEEQLKPCCPDAIVSTTAALKKALFTMVQEETNN